MAALSFSDQDLAAFEEVAVIHDRTKFCALLSDFIAREVAKAVAPSFRAESPWEPTSNQLQRGRVLLLKEFRKPHNLTIAQFATLAGKSRQQIYKDISSRRLLAISVGARGQRIPDWQIDEIKKKLIRGLLEATPGVDEWTLYYGLIEPNRDFAGKSPIETVTSGNLKRTLGTILNQLGFHD